MLGTCALIMCHLAGLVLLQSDFLAGILFLRQSLIKGRGLSWIWWVKCILRYIPPSEGVERTTKTQRTQRLIDPM